MQVILDELPVEHHVAIHQDDVLALGDGERRIA